MLWNSNWLLCFLITGLVVTVLLHEPGTLRAVDLLDGIGVLVTVPNTGEFLLFVITENILLGWPWLTFQGDFVM